MLLITIVPKVPFVLWAGEDCKDLFPCRERPKIFLLSFNKLHTSGMAAQSSQALLIPIPVPAYCFRLNQNLGTFQPKSGSSIYVNKGKPSTGSFPHPFKTKAKPFTDVLKVWIECWDLALLVKPKLKKLPVIPWPPIPRPIPHFSPLGLAKEMLMGLCHKPWNNLG